MKPVENGQSPHESIVGTFPKFSIDPRIRILDAHSRRDPVEFLSCADRDTHVSLAFAAAQMLFEALRPALEYIEVVKVSFCWDRNLPTPLTICVGIVMVEPLTQRKARVEVESEVGMSNPEHSDEFDCVKAVAALRERVLAAMSRKVRLLRTEREKSVPSLQRFDTLFDTD